MGGAAGLSAAFSAGMWAGIRTAKPDPGVNAAPARRPEKERDMA
ncbi:MAG: hypothetical protein JWM59_1649 [Verrucomicrobiales bacterium]|nr:hypothetical protein [Verrucomicrobiales bacterium]